MKWALAQLFPAPAFWFTRYLIMVPSPLPAAALVVRRRYLIVVPRSMPAAPRRYLIEVPKPLPAAPLVERCKYLVVVPRPIPRRRAGTWSCCPGRSLRHRSLCVAGT